MNTKDEQLYSPGGYSILEKNYIIHTSAVFEMK
jgi:hypothetical protein